MYRMHRQTDRQDRQTAGLPAAEAVSWTRARSVARSRLMASDSVIEKLLAPGTPRSAAAIRTATPMSKASSRERVDNIQTDRQTDRQTGQTGRQSDRQTDKKCARTHGTHARTALSPAHPERGRGVSVAPVAQLADGNRAGLLGDAPVPRKYRHRVALECSRRKLGDRACQRFPGGRCERF